MADSEAADINITGGVNGDLSEFDDSNAKKTDDHLMRRIGELEREKRDLVKENGEMKAAKTERSEMEREAMESITKRAFELEGEVVRLQHDLATSMSAGEEAKREIEALRGEIQKLSEQADELERLKSDSEARIIELEKEIERSKEREIAAAEQAKALSDEMEREIIQLKKEKEEVEDATGALRAELKRSEEKVIETEGRVSELLKKSAESEKAAQSEIEGIVEAGEGDGGLRGLKEKKRFPVAGAVSAGVVVAALAVCYLRFRKTR